MKHTYLAAFVALSVTLCAVSAVGFEVRTLRSGGIGHTTILSRSTASELLAVGHGFSAHGDWSFDAGYARRFELKELDQFSLVGAARWRWISIAAGASQFGQTDLYAEQILKGAVTAHWRQWALGIGLSAMQIQTGGTYVDLRAATVGASLAYRHESFIIAATADNLTRPELSPGSLPEEAEYTLSAEYIGQTAYSLMGRVRVKPKEQPRFGLGQMIRLSRHGAFYWGIATKPLEFGGGIELFLPGDMAITYTTSVHPTLGFTHTVSWSIGSAVGWSLKDKHLD